MLTLPSEKYDIARAALVAVPINHLFARAVLEGDGIGHVMTDSHQQPSTFYVANEYGMSFLFGKSEDAHFMEQLTDYLLDRGHKRRNAEWLQVFSSSWCTHLEQALGSALLDLGDEQPPEEEPGVDARVVTQHTRLNFRFDRERFERFEQTLPPSSLPIRKIDERIFAEASSTVAPRFFWKSAERYLRKGAGYSAMDGDFPAATAFSAFRLDTQLEIGVETAESHRRRGLAQHVAATLIRYCIANGLEPVWACRLDNVESYRLAIKLGFVPTFHVPYYRLPVSRLAAAA